MEGKQYPTDAFETVKALLREQDEVVNAVTSGASKAEMAAARRKGAAIASKIDKYRDKYPDISYAAGQELLNSD